jgi:hypothetical protein
MFQKILVDAVGNGKETHSGSAELSVNLESTRGHGSLLLAPKYFHSVGSSKFTHTAFLDESKSPAPSLKLDWYC